MDYPAKLERAASAATAAAAEANGSSGYGTSYPLPEDEDSHGNDQQPGVSGNGVNGSQQRSASRAVRP